MVRNFFRILILGFGAFLLYFSITNRLNWVGFFAFFIVLVLFYLATYVRTLKQANKDASLPTLVDDENLKSSVKSYFEFRLGINNPFLEDKIGRKTFYPSGPFGKGYYIPDSARGEEIKNLNRAVGGISMAVFAIGIFMGSLGNPVVWIYVFTVLLILWLWHRIAMRKILNGLEAIEIGSENYSPPNFEIRYRWLAVALMACGIIGGTGDIYNKGFSIVDFILVVGCTLFLVSYSYVTWIRRPDLS